MEYQLFESYIVGRHRQAARQAGRARHCQAYVIFSFILISFFLRRRQRSHRMSRTDGENHIESIILTCICVLAARGVDANQTV